MRSVSAGLNTHINGVPTTVAKCVKITPLAGAVVAMTDHAGGSLVVDAVTYARRGFALGDLRLSVDLSVGGFDLDALYSSAFTLADVRAGRYAGAVVELFEVNYADLTMGKLPLFEGLVGAVLPAELGARLEINSRKKLLENPIIERYTPDCRAILGDARCTKNLTTFTFAGTVDTVTSREIFAVTAGFTGPATAGYFSYGVVSFTSGANNGVSREIKGYVSGSRTFTLRRAFPFDIAAGNTLNAVAGCDKKFTTCKDKFDNVPFFRGEPHIPTQRKLSSYFRDWFNGHQGGFRFGDIGSFF